MPLARLLCDQLVGMLLGLRIIGEGLRAGRSSHAATTIALGPFPAADIDFPEFVAAAEGFGRVSVSLQEQGSTVDGELHFLQ